MTDFGTDFLGSEFIWFIGIVEDRNDPLRLGRVRVRCLGWHTTDADQLPTEALPWADTVQPVNQPAGTPGGLLVDAWVFGFFMDGKKGQRPCIMGLFPGYGNVSSTVTDIESELPRLGRQEPGYFPPESVNRADNRVTDIPVFGPDGDGWEEPEEPGEAMYPYVQTNWSESGFIRAVVSTPGHSRITEYHPSGTYNEVQTSGLRNTKTVDNKYDIVLKDDYQNVKGTRNVTIEGDFNLNVLGNWTVNVEGNKTEVVNGNVLELYDQNQTTNVRGNVIIQTGDNILLNPPAYSLDFL